MRMTTRAFRERGGGPALDLRNALRRMVVAATDAVLWALDGFEDDEGNVEREDAEVFSGIGFYARPASGADAEAVIVKIGGQSGHPVVVATRDERARQALEAADGAVAAGETALYNPGAVVRLTNSGEIHARAPGGAAVALATKADIDALRTWVAAQFTGPGHVHGVSGAVTNSTTPVAAPLVTPPSAAGTSRLRGQ